MAALESFFPHLSSAFCVQSSYQAPVTQRGKSAPSLDEEGSAYQHLLWRPVRRQRYEGAKKAKREECPTTKSLLRAGDIQSGPEGQSHKMGWRDSGLRAQPETWSVQEIPWASRTQEHDIKIGNFRRFQKPGHGGLSMPNHRNLLFS